ncbi:MAG: hypothetical protein RLZZ165_2416 [Bacteroidota bacterium]
MTGQYRELVAFGDSALAAGQDYFALRYRIGAACFHLERYAAAARHFGKAHEFHSGEPETMEYLYFSLYRSGQIHAAQLLVKDMLPSLRKKLGLKTQQLISRLNLESGSKRSSNTGITGNMSTLSLNVTHLLAARWRLSQGIGVLSQGLPGGRYGQLNYFAAPNAYLGKGFNATGVLHLLGLKGSLPPQHPPFLPPPPGGWPDARLSSTGHLLHLSLGYQKAYFQLKASANRTSLQTSIRTQTPLGARDSVTNISAWQAGVALDLNPPILQQRILLSVAASLHRQSASSLLTWLSIGGYPVRNIYLEARYFKCGTSNFNEFDGTLVNNSADPLKDRISGLAQFNLSTRLGLYLLYQHETKSSSLDARPFRYNSFFTGINVNL